MMKHTIKRATLEHCEALYQLWMQDHINPYMFFEKMTVEQFIPIYQSLLESSEIYFLENAANEIVAVRRLVYGHDETVHTAYFCSFGVDKNHLKQGYGSLFYQYFYQILSCKPEITRIELSQETDNNAALQLAQKQGFQIEAISPEWLKRETGTHKDAWYVGERFLALHVSPIDINTITSLAIEYQLQIPKVIENTIKLSGKWVEANGANIYFFDDKPMLRVILVEQGSYRYAHLDTWRIESEPDFSLQETEHALRALILDSKLKNPELKKIEILISDPNVILLASQLGFHCRGEKIRSKKQGAELLNELLLDFSFFDISNIDQLFRSTSVLEKFDNYKKMKIKNYLQACLTTINTIKDPYCRIYLENMAFQIVRESCTSIKMYPNAENAPWLNLLSKFDHPELKNNFENLLNYLGFECKEKESLDKERVYARRASRFSNSTQAV